MISTILDDIMNSCLVDVTNMNERVRWVFLKAKKTAPSAQSIIILIHEAEQMAFHGHKAGKI